MCVYLVSDRMPVSCPLRYEHLTVTGQRHLCGGKRSAGKVWRLRLKTKGSQGTVIVIKPSHYRVKCTSDTQANNKKINEDTRPYINQHKIDK